MWTRSLQIVIYHAYEFHTDKPVPPAKVTSNTNIQNLIDLKSSSAPLFSTFCTLLTLFVRRFL